MRRQESTMWWSDAELAQLQSRYTIEYTKGQVADISKVYHRLFPYLTTRYPTMFDAKVQTMEAFMWATLTCWGRAFNVAGYNSTYASEYGLIPIADLLNHQAGKESSWVMHFHDSERRYDPTMYIFSANADYQPGEEVRTRRARANGSLLRCSRILSVTRLRFRMATIDLQPTL